MLNILLLVCVILLIIAFVRIMLIYFKTKNIKIEDVRGFDILKELTSNYDEINIVESNESVISKYNLKRRVIRLTSKDYNSNDLFTLGKVSFLASYSILKVNRDKNIDMISKVLPNIDYFNKSSFIALLISIFFNTKGDAKIAIILLSIILVYQYLINEINITSKDEIKKELESILKNKNFSLVEEVQNSFLFLNKISFITTLILILRAILIIIM